MFRFSDKESHIEVIIDSPPYNLFNINDLRSFETLINEVEDRPFIIIYGESDIFSYGFDYNSLKELSRLEIESIIKYIKRVFNRIRLFDGYVITAIQGVALDEAFELALMSDYIIAEPNSKLGFSKSRMKYLFSLGGLNRIIERGGEYLFNKLIFEGGVLTGEYAYELRFIDFIDENPLWYARNLSSLMIEEFGMEGVYKMKSFMKEKYLHHDSLILSIEDKLLNNLGLEYDLCEIFKILRHEF